MSALEIINFDSKNVIANLIRTLIKTANFKINFHWVKAHIGIKYNEIVDMMAKEATEKINIDIVVGFSKIQIKNLGNKEKLKIWQDHWTNSEKGRHTYSIFSSVSTHRVIGNFYINQLLTGHGSNAMYQNKFHNKSNICICEDTLGSIQHIIFECPLLAEIRNKYFPKNFIEVPIINLLSNLKSRMGLYVMAKFMFEKYTA